MRYIQSVSYVTTPEKKNGFLLIEVFKKLFNLQIYGHQDSILGGRFYIAGFIMLQSNNLKNIMR